MRNDDITLYFDTYRLARAAFEVCLSSANRAYFANGQERIVTASGDIVRFKVKDQDRCLPVRRRR